MRRVLVGIFLPAVMLLSALCVRAELTRDEKQSALDYHNLLRSEEKASNMRQMQWDKLLAETAQEYADNCFFRPNPVVTIPNHPSLGRVRKGENLYISGFGEDIQSAIRSWYDEGGSSYTQLVWADTYLLGCGAANCPKLSFTGSFTSGTLIVCNYLPSYISGSEAFKSGTCSSSSCPVDASICSNGLCAPSSEPPQVPEDDIETSVDRKVWYFTPTIGSLSGGTRITIHGEGFSSNQFEGRNEVILTNGDFDVPCDVISYYSNTNPTGNDQIVCDTRPSPDGMNGQYEIIVRVDDGKGLEETDPCAFGSCTFRYHSNFWTPLLEEIDPVAMPAGELGLLFFSGRFYTAVFQEDLDNAGVEYFTRLLVGGLPCDPMDENGTLYGAQMTSSARSDIMCQPSTDNIIDSMNVTAILAIRGSSFVEFDEYLLTLDNKLRPYTFQTYAEIVQVSPSAGSIMGGTRISVYLNILVTNYTDNDVEVYVGGVPCEDVILVPPNMVECTTGPQPPSTTYYPCGRGLLREVWISESGSFNELNLDDTDQRPRSELTSVQERLYRDNSHTREFGERFFFTQRYSGFFIPPLTCLYTFSILSDDLCRLYLSPNNSADHKELIAYSPQWTRGIWDYWPSQVSEPVYLEEGKPYYIEATNNQGTGPWELGVGAKIHCLDHTAYPYDGDREIQRINISSIDVKEQHEIILGALPVVQKILITYGSYAQQQEELMEAEICFDIGDELVSFYPDYPSEYIENMLNEVESIKAIGYVEVIKEEVETYGFYFTVIFLSRFGVTESEIPLLSISNSSSPLCNQTLYDITIEKIQSLTIPESFNLGFNDTYPPRYTSYLPYDVTLDTLRSEITDLFAWECEVSPSPSSLLFQDSYEEESRDNSTSFCGHYSAKNPTTIWANQNNPINIVLYKELCFAYWGLPPGLKASIDYFDADSREPEDADIDLSNCVDNWPTTTQHPNWQYICIDISLCFTKEQGSQLLPHMTQLTFDGTGNAFWIDEVSISFSEVSVTQVPPGPAQPGGVSVNYIEVQGGVFDMAELQNRSRGNSSNSHASGYGSGSGAHFHDRDPEYVMTLGTYTITYIVHDCGSGIPPLTGYLMVDGYEPESVKIDVEQTALGSASVDGTFELSFGGRSIRNIPADISNSDLEVLLEANFRDEEGFSVTRTGTCAGYKWDVEWENKGGDIPSMEASGAGLGGSDPEITVETVVDGGVWVRPLRADMLRVPKDDPQVEVIVNDIPSSCKDSVCTFNFTSDATPQVHLLTPDEGQGGTPITIYGDDFTNDISKITVAIGNSNCYVTEVNETHILCTAADHPAGFYQVSVHIEGVGYADIDQSLCFHYLLSVDSVTPDSGSIGGGQTVVISGNGFLDLVPLEAEELRDPLDVLPWFASGFGIPSSNNFDALCPFLNDLFNFTDFGDSFDFVDEDSDEDMYQSYSHNDFNETVSNHTFNRTDSMPDFEGSFDIEEFYSVLELIYSTFPSVVLIGEFPCIIVSSSLTTIECTTIPHLPGRVNVTVMVLGERASLRNAYEYSVNDSAIVSSVSPSSGPSYGGTSLQITGTKFLSDDPDSELYIQVQIGSSNCNITSANDTHIECVTQPHSPGYESILVTTANGIAVWELSLLAQNITLGKYFESDIGSGGFTDQDIPLFPLYEYQFYVFSIAPLLGSVFGGTTLQVWGIGFENGVTEVYIGDNLCDNRFVNDTLIECVTPSSSEVHMVYFVNDTGFDPDEGYLFSWSETDLNISVGDTVYWEWTLNLQGFQVNVFQTPDSSQSTPLQGGFSSNSSASGSFRYTFSEPGVYYYASELNPTLILRGKINVGEIQSSTADIQVVDSVNGFKADYILLTDTDDGSAIVDPFFNSEKEYYDSYKDSQAPDDNPQSMNCTGEEDDSPVYDQYYGSHFPAFMYSVCATPVVYSINPKEGTLGTTFTIEGIGFSPESTVRFGDHECTVTNSSSTVILCEIDPDSTPPTFVELPLAVNVHGLGNAYVEYPSSMVITLRPIIINIAPNNGSVAGGTGVVITGWGIPEEYDIDVLIGTYPCAIISQNYTEIQCTTQSAASAGEHPLTVLINGLYTAECGIATGCTFEYSDEMTPVVTNVSPTIIQGPGTIMLDINGTGFSTIPTDNKIYIGEYPCSPIQSTSNSIQCQMDPIPAGMYELSLMICTEPPPESFDDSIQCYGNASIMVPPLESASNVTSVSPQSGSGLGGTMLTISGVGFESDTSLISVNIGGNPCTVIDADYSTIYCSTVVPTAPGTFTINVVSNGIDFPGSVEFTYDVIPLVFGVFPPSGQQGQMVTFSGSGFGINPIDTVIMIGDSPCGVDTSSSNDTSLQCLLGGNFVGYYSVNINIGGIGDADTTDVDDFFYILRLDDFSPKSGSLAGLNPLTVTGLGLNPNFITITICDAICELTVSVPTLTEIECVVPPMSVLDVDNGEINCVVTIESLGESETFEDMYVYQSIQTPVVNSINRTRGGTQGGSRILLTGGGFTGDANVTIAGVECEILEKSETSIVCETGASGRTVRENVLVYINDKGYAMSEGIEFWYVDLWSSRFTWGGGPLPEEGDFVVIPRGQTLILDTVTPVLGYLLIQGGELIFDDEQEDDMVQLHTQGALITEGGRLQVGTEDEPFLHKTRIILYGHVLSTEIPIYGAKTLALREGEIDMHGRPLDVTWTRLNQTAYPGDTTLYLQEAVDWEVGGKIVIASTSYSQRENEEFEITGISNSGYTLTISPALEYEHISIQQEIEGRYIDTSAEVGYLTRNVLVRGNLNEEWEERVEGCDEEFRPGQFEIQTCFLGRFGAETINDQFGSQIMIHAAAPNKGDVVGRFEYVEVTHAGQAFRLGRYPIHYHLNGNVSTSYVRGCAIHHTFNRAVTIHAVDYLLVEKNVAYNILGHAYFLEDGIEEHNIIQDNLGIFIRGSSSLLNVDITPATFWIVNPNNIVRRNAAAGGTHFGYWYRLPEHPTGPSETSSVCPRKLPLEEFSNNTAHSFGWYGLWVMPRYEPRVGGGCNDLVHTPAVFRGLLAWRNDRGIEFTEVGSLQVKDCILLDNRLAGVEVSVLEAEWGENGPLIQDTLIVGHSEISDTSICTESGIKTPHTYYLTVSGVTFVNFDQPGCFSFQACSECKPLQGGFETRYENIKFINSPQITQWQWEHEHVHRFLDDSLPDTTGPSSLIPTSGILPTSSCQHHAASSNAKVNGSICDGSIEFGRFAVFDPIPTSIQFSDLHVSNEYGTTVLPYKAKQLLTGPGHMAIVELNQTFQLEWPSGTQFTNFSYSEIISGFGSDDYIILSQTFPRSLDFISLNGDVTNENATVFDDPSKASTGDWYINDNNTLSYIIKGTSDPPVDDQLQFSTYRCLYEDCIVPPPPTLAPPGRPEVFVKWSNVSIWPDERLPERGEDVYINCSFHVVVDVELPPFGTITICGGMELEDTMDHVIEADIILLQGGSLIAGYPDVPFENRATFVLNGNISSPEVHLNQGPTLGAKAIGVFGELILHGLPPEKTWTRLEETATAGSDTIRVVDSVDWKEGDRIVITSTSFEAKQSEVFEIVEVSDNEITLDGSLTFDHIVDSGSQFALSYSISAEVGLLTRNIVIENGQSDVADEEAFGCRVLVGSYFDDQFFYSGSAQINGVEFSGCGQRGYTESFDPRFSLAFLTIGSQGYASYVTNSSFHDGYNTAIGVFGTHEILVDNNVIHVTVGPSVQVTGLGHNVTNNLASFAQFPGIYRDANEPLNSDWTANFEVMEAERLKLVGNVAAGGGKAGFHTNGEACEAGGSDEITGNVAHSTLHGIHMGYEDGHPSGCSKLSGFTIFNCYHYGIFAYGQAGIWITDTALVNNYAGVYISVIGPASLTHIVGDKQVVIENSIIISASEQHECAQDDIVPEISEHETSHRGIRSASGGHVGIVIPSFLSGQGHFPLEAWFSIISYPAISGLTTIRNVGFDNFAQRCGNQKDVVLITNARSEDCNHPVHFENIAMLRTEAEYKFFNHEPHLSSVNPSDCVDMDCDGLKHVLIKDLDGSFTESTDPRSLISMAENEWDGMEERGIGDYRIPRTMLTLTDGSRVEADELYPSKGALRGTEFGNGSQCTFNNIWNAYECSELDHLMLVIESLDADTEVRRLSPIGLGANGFIDLLNGPQDNGWCGGYTCQERISTFYSIVAVGYEYAIGLTSTNPQKMALHLLNSNSNQAIVVGIIYTNPQRLDIYYEGGYVTPKNAEQQSDGNLIYEQKDPDKPREFVPLLSDEPGTNYYDRDEKKLYITIKGSSPIEIRTQPVIQVSLELSVSPTDFFDPDRLVENLAFLLGIPSTKIRIVNVIRETISRRKRQTGSDTVTVDFEIGNTPTNGTNATSPDGQNATETDIDLTAEVLEMLTPVLVQTIQTGEILENVSDTATVESATLQEAEPPPNDPTNGVRATPATGGPQPDNITNSSIPTFYEMQIMEERAEENETATITLSVPTELVIIRQPEGPTEGLPFPQPPLVVMHDNNGEVVENLGFGDPWVLTATIETGPEGAYLTEASVNMTNGIANFTKLILSHPGSYMLKFTITYPLDVDISAITSEAFSVEQRSLQLLISREPTDGNTSRAIYPYPTVNLLDPETNRIVTNHGWRNRTWYISASIDIINVWTAEEVSDGEAKFTDIIVPEAGRYQIVFTAFTDPVSPPQELPVSVTSDPFEIIQRPFTRVVVVYDDDFATIIPEGQEEDFIQAFRLNILEVYNYLEVYNVTLRNGSIIVSFFATANTADELMMFVDDVTSDNDTLAFIFRNTLLTPISITQDSDYPVVFPTQPPSEEDELVLILATAIPGGTILLLTIVVIVIVLICQRHKKNTKVFIIKVKPAAPNPEFEGRYVEHRAQHFMGSSETQSMDSYYLLHDNKLKDLESQSVDEHEMTEMNSKQPVEVEIVVSKEISVPATTSSGMMFTNPTAISAIGSLDLDDSFEEILGQSVDNSNNNNNNNLKVVLPNVVPDTKSVMKKALSSSPIHQLRGPRNLGDLKIESYDSTSL